MAKWWMIGGEKDGKFECYLYKAGTESSIRKELREEEIFSELKFINEIVILEAGWNVAIEGLTDMDSIMDPSPSELFEFFYHLGYAQGKSESEK